MVQANPQILQVRTNSLAFDYENINVGSNIRVMHVAQPMLHELGKQNPQLLRMIQEHQPEFLQLINEPLEGSEG